MIDDVAVLLADARPGIPTDEDGGRVLEDHEHEQDEAEGPAGRICVARFLRNGDVGRLRRRATLAYGGHDARVVLNTRQ